MTEDRSELWDRIAVLTEERDEWREQAENHVVVLRETAEVMRVMQSQLREVRIQLDNAQTLLGHATNAMAA